MPVYAQLSLIKMVGKKAPDYKWGYGMFLAFDFPLKHKNQSIKAELLDIGLFPGKDVYYAWGYISSRLGYKYIFSDTKTGFFIEPSVGYCWVLYAEPYLPEATSKNGIAAAFEAGYNLETGKKGHSMALGFKYEYDRAEDDYILSSIGFRISYSFNIFHKKNHHRK